MNPTQPISTVSSKTVALLMLTQVRDNQFAGNIQVKARDIIAYQQAKGFTRLSLTGRRVIDVRETTDRIDYLIRSSATQPSVFVKA